MSKRPSHHIGTFAKGLTERHFNGRSAKGKRLAIKAEIARKRRVHRLIRTHPDNPAAQALANKLAACRPKRRCLSGACPVCAQAAQEQVVDLGKEFKKAGQQAAGLNQKKKPMMPVTLTVVPSFGALPPGQLETLSIEKVHRRVTDRLAQARVRLAIGVLEVCLAKHTENRYSPTWVWHLHGLAMTRNPQALKKRLELAFPRTDLVPRPVCSVPWDERSRWLRYCHKLDTRCRLGADDEPRFDLLKKKDRKCRTTSPSKLTESELLELLLFHDEFSLDSRIVTKGAQLRSTGNGCRIVKLRRPRR